MLIVGGRGLEAVEFDCGWLRVDLAENGVRRTISLSVIRLIILEDSAVLRELTNGKGLVHLLKGLRRECIFRLLHREYVKISEFP